MVFSWRSWRCCCSSSGPRRAGCCEAHCGGWVGPTALLCIYGFCSLLRPVDPFLTQLLTGPLKNLTTHQVTTEVFPIWTYSNVVMLIPVFLVTDFLRYKPVIVLQALCYMAAFTLLLLGQGVRTAQVALFVYSTGSAADMGYFSYIYSVIPPRHYQRATSYVRGAVLLGYAAGALLGQMLVSLGGVSLSCLTVATLVSLGAALLTSLFLPMPASRLLRCPARRQRDGSAAEEAGSSSSSSSQSPDVSLLVWMRDKCLGTVRYVGRALKRLLLDCRDCYSSAAMLFFCMWQAAGRCGFYQVTNYVQVLWEYMEPHANFTAYNGGVDAIATLSGAGASIAVGHVPVNWSVWGELVLGGFTALIAGSLFLMDLTNNIWLCYGCYIVFKALYMQLITICTFQIAKKLSRERYALVFGVNSFVGTVLQTVLTAIVINTKSLQLTIISQFFIYASYFAAIALVFLVRGTYTVLLSVKRPPAADGHEQQTHETPAAAQLPPVPEGTHTHL